MPKAEWGTKRVCPTTGKRFYDLNRDPIVSPYTGEVVTLDTGRARSQIAEKPAKAKPEAEAEPAVLEDDATSNEVDLGDDVLEEDEDENVSLDDIADVAPEDDES